MCQLANRRLTTASSAMRLCRVKSPKSTSSAPVSVRARSMAEVELRQSSKNIIDVSNGWFQSICDVWMYCRRKRMANTLNTFKMVVRLGGWSLNRL